MPRSTPKIVRKIYFSDVFSVPKQMLRRYGAFDIALVNDLPLFIDPFLLFDSKKKKFRELHDSIIDYLCFVKDQAVAGELTAGRISHWLYFKEVKQNWLGFSKTGNKGTGLGKDFANALARNLTSVFANFGKETISRTHMEKLSLLSNGVGRDHLSDFTTNLIKKFLLEYTQSFAVKHLRQDQRKQFRIERVEFDYTTQRWRSGLYELPFVNGDFVLLTPKEILTRDDAWINQGDMLNRFSEICVSIPDKHLRQQVDEHFRSQITRRSTEKQLRAAALNTIEKFHELVDRYIKWKEDHGDQAHSQSSAKVHATELQFIANVRKLVDDHLSKGEFYGLGQSYEASLKRVKYLKHVVEDQDGYKAFYIKGKPIARESDLHIMYRLTWFDTELDVNAEVNNGRGPVDFKVSRGRKDASLVEFKLAKNTSLEKNLANQVKIYERASETNRSIKVIVHFTDSERRRVTKILKRLKLEGSKDIVLIDASPKVSASKADSSPGDDSE